ncbi:hypothetical protein Tco_0485788, partial [Tanacetum coccineum]
PAQSQTSSVPDQQYQLYLAMKADPQLTLSVRLRDQDNPHDDAHLEGENSAKQQKTSEYEAYVSGELYHCLDKFFKRNKLHQPQVIKNKMMILFLD